MKLEVTTVHNVASHSQRGQHSNAMAYENSSFFKVVHSCFGKEAHDNYREQINTFEKWSFEIYMDFDVNFSTKAHILITHVPQVIERTGKGLFFQSEEVVEATHSKDIFWQRFKVIDVESEKHGERLLECVLEFNTKNI